MPASNVTPVQAGGDDQPKANVIYLNAGAIDTDLPTTQARRQPLAYFPGKRMQLIQWNGPVQPGWVEELKRLGVEIIDYIPENAYLVYGDWNVLSAMQKRMADKNYVRWEGAYRPQDKIQPNALAADGSNGPANRPEPELFSIQMVLNPKANAETLEKIEAMQIAAPLKQGASGNYYNIVAKLPPAQIASLAEQPDIISIGPYQTPKKRDERQCIIMTGQLTNNGPTGPGYLDWLTSRGFTQAQFDASGLVVDVTDSPIDNGTTNVNHFALYKDGTITNSPSRVVYTRLEGTPNAGSVTQAQDGHGNINAHIIAGQVNLSGTPHVDSSGYRYGMGVAPYVKVGGSIIFDVNNFTSPNYDNLAARAYRDGARVSGNSWGADTAGAYDADAQNYDRLVRDAQPSGSAVATAGNQQMTFVFAAGNAGSGASTVGSPGTAKNVITAGAAENVHPFGGSDGSQISDTGANSANDVISFSSRGPCADQRKKPDIMAPGTHVTGGVPQAVKTMSGTGTKLAIFDGSGVSGGVNSIYFPSAGQQFYTASSGTSHSTPAVAGAAALVYQWFINKGWATAGNPASPAMIKAYLMNASRYMTGVSANDTLYSNSQGMGMVNLDTSFDDTPRYLRDQLTTDIFTASGQSRSWTGTIVSSSKPVRITVAWTDAPGSTTGNAYKNNLDLTVVVNGTTYRGNVFTGANSTTGGSADVRNNVESVFLPAGTTGNVSITVAGTNINSDGVPNFGTTIDQDFALVAYNFNQVNSASVVSAGSTLVAEDGNPTNNAIDPDELVTVAFGLRNVGSLDASNVTATLLATNGVTPVTTEPQSYGSLLTNGVAVTNNFQFRVTGTVGNNFDAVLSLQDGTNNLGTIPYTFRIGPPPPILLNEDFVSLTAGSEASPSSTEVTSNLTTNFPTSVKAYSAGGVVKLGSGSAAGSITSRALDLSGNGGVFSVQFDVKGWTTVEGQIRVTVGSLPVQTVTYTATSSGSYESRFVNFTGGTNNSTVKIETTAKRAYLDNVVVASQAVYVAPPVISSSLTASATVGTAFTYTVTASESPTSFVATGLPAGLSINTTSGVISGTPTTAGASNVTISATNAGGTGSATLVLTVSNPPPPVISSSLTATGVVGTAFSYQITASNSPTSYAATGLPAGLSINTTTGVISGTPTAAGTSNVNITATNAGGTGSATLVVTINIAPPVVSSAGTASGVVGAAFTYQIAASGSPSSYGATSLPTGLTVDTSTGIISGTPTTAGTTTATVRATNAGGTGSKSLVITITSAGAPALIAGWDFQTTNTGGTAAATAPNSPTVYTANFGTGTIYLNGSNGSSSWITATTGNEVTAFGGTTINAGSGFSTTTSGASALALVGGTGQSANGKKLVLTFSMANRSNLSISYALRRGSTGFTTNSWEYSTNGTNWLLLSVITNMPTVDNFGALSLSNISALDGVTSAFLRITFNGATTNVGNNRVDNIQLLAAPASPSVQVTGSIAALSTSYGMASGPASFSLSGSSLTEGILVTPPSAFEVSKTTGGLSGYSSNQIVGGAGTVSATTVYVRLASTNPAGPYSGDIVCNSAGSAGATVAIPSSIVAKKDVSITGLVGVDKIYDGTTAADFTGTPTYSGLVNGESFTVTGSPTAAFDTAGVSSGKTVTVTGYNAPSSNYNLLPVSLAANITAKPVAITGLTGVDKVYDGTLMAGLTGSPQIQDLVTADLGNVSVAGAPTAEFASANVGTDIGITVSGYSLTGAAAGNYWPVQPSDLTASITPKSATVTAANRIKPRGQTITLGPNQASGFSAVYLVAGEKVDRVTLTASGGTRADDPNGEYSITPSDASAVPSNPPNPFRTANYNITYVSGTLSVVDPITEVTLSDWATQKGLTGDNRLPDADPDGDGMSNLMEFFLGLDPTEPGGTSGPVMTFSNGPGNTLTMTYRRAKGVTGISSGVQTIGDLSTTNWGTNGVQETVVDKGTHEEVTATVTNQPGETRKFMRLKVSQP